MGHFQYLSTQSSIPDFAPAAILWVLCSYNNDNRRRPPYSYPFRLRERLPRSRNGMRIMTDVAGQQHQDGLVRDSGNGTAKAGTSMAAVGRTRTALANGQIGCGRDQDSRGRGNLQRAIRLGSSYRRGRSFRRSSSYCGCTDDGVCQTAGCGGCLLSSHWRLFRLRLSRFHPRWSLSHS